MFQLEEFFTDLVTYVACIEVQVSLRAGNSLCSSSALLLQPFVRPLQKLWPRDGAR